MNSNPPCVSIGMPVFNGEAFLAVALDAILTQTFTDFELIISDNASIDRTEEICRTYAAQDSRIHYYRSPQNFGAAWNFNHVFQLARGQYFKWAAHDDLLAPTALQRCVESLDRDSSTVLCASQVGCINWKGETIPLKCDPHDRALDAEQPSRRLQGILLQTFWCYEIFGLIRASALRKTPPMGNHYGSDRVILATLVLQGRFAEIPETLLLRRFHLKQSTSIQSAKEREQWLTGATQPKTRLLERQSVRCLKAVLKADLDWSERLRCLAILNRYLTHPKNWHYFLRQWFNPKFNPKRTPAVPWCDHEVLQEGRQDKPQSLCDLGAK
jgi:glycosyltransferase involved in cell wall biosynthesis